MLPEMKTITIGTKDTGQFPANQYASQGNAILGIRDSGKSHTAMKIAEELMDAGIAIIAFDPTGIWKNLRIGTNGGKGYPVVVAGGNDPDIKLTVDNIETIIRAAMKENVSLVIDLYSPELANKSTWIKIVEKSVKLLLYENGSHALRHIFIEEAAEFIPQRIRPQQSHVYDQIERLARMGRNFKLGYTVINQRAEEINKAILEICECSFLHKQVGKNSMLSLKKWFEVLQTDGKIVNEILGRLPQLEQGQCYLCGREEMKLITVARKKTYHPDPKKADSQILRSAESKTDIKKFVQKLLGAMEKEVDPKDAAINHTLKESNNMVKEVQELRLRNNFLESKIKEIEIKFNNAANAFKGMKDDLRRHFDDAMRTFVFPPATSSHITKSVPAVTSRVGIPKLLVGKAPNINDNGSAKFGACEMALLRVLAQRNNVNTSKAQLSILSHYSIKSSSFAKGLSNLRTQGFISQGEPIAITNDGYEKAVTIGFEKMPSGEHLQEYWINNLGKAEAAMLQIFFNRGQEGCDKEDLAESSGYSITSSSFAKALSKLRTLQLIEPNDHNLRAANIFFQ